MEFNSLFTMTNMPIKRFADFLYRRNELSDYLELLVRNFNEDTVPSLMCTNTVSIGWDGKVYDCDFNQQLDLQLTTQEVGPSSTSSSTTTTTTTEPAAAGGACGKRNEAKTSSAVAPPQGIADIFSLDSLDDLRKVPVNIDSHCYGCTAGMGSS